MRHNSFARPLRLMTSLLFLLMLIGSVSAAQQGEEITITMNSTEIVDTTGNAQAKATISFSPSRGYDRIRRLYTNLYVPFRDLGSGRSNFETKRGTLKIVSDDAERTISLNAEILGVAVCRSGHWQISLSANEQLSMQDNVRVSTVAQSSGQAAVKMISITNYVLPAKAQNVRFDKDAHLITYTLPKPLPGVGPPSVDVSVRCKERLMAAVYKIYADSKANEGAYWVAKTLFTNTGKTPIFDLKIYYRLGDYTELSVPEPYSMVMPGGSVADLYYPIIKSKVSELRTITPLQLYIRYEYRDAVGRPYSGELTKQQDMLGINQFEFSNLNDEDRTDSWFDFFNNAPLLAAFVTRLDDPVKQFAGYVSQAAGGAAANADDESAKHWLQAAYELEVQNGFSYQTPSGFKLTKDRSSGQDIKYPRDVFRDKSGTCVDLAITYAALAEAVGLKANLMLVEGHAFPVIFLPSGRPYPVETTGIGGVGHSISFQQAVEYGDKEFRKYLDGGIFYFVKIDEELNSAGVRNPELAQVGNDFLEKSGIKRQSGLPGETTVPRSAGSNANVIAASQASDMGRSYLVVHDHGLGNLATFCVGVLYVTDDAVIFSSSKSTDGRLDHFEIRKSEIKEARKNRMPLGQQGAYYEGFHIRLQNGVNFNFARIDQNGRALSADEVLMALMR